MKNIVSLVLALGFVGTAAMARRHQHLDHYHHRACQEAGRKHRTHRTVRKHTTTKLGRRRHHLDLHNYRQVVQGSIPVSKSLQLYAAGTFFLRQTNLRFARRLSFDRPAVGCHRGIRPRTPLQCSANFGQSLLSRELTGSIGLFDIFRMFRENRYAADIGIDYHVRYCSCRSSETASTISASREAIPFK